MVLNLRIFIFATREIRGRWFQIWQYHFQILVPKFGNLEFLVPNLRIFIFCTKLCNKANSRVLTSNMTMVFQNCCPKHPNKVFLALNLRILIFARNFAIRQFGGRWLEILQWFFNIPARDTNRAFLVPNFFSFWMKLYTFTNWSVLIKNLTIVFVKLQPKNTQVRYFWFHV